MAEIVVAGVMRAGAYSPNHIGNDGAIMNAVADHLRKRGCVVNIYSEGQLQNGEVSEDVILNMCRERESIPLLQKYEREGRLVINSGFGIENCTREIMVPLFLGNNIPYPESIIVATNENVADRLRENGFGAVWIKRADYHAQHKEDVSYCRRADEAQEMLHEYYYRGIKRAVINRHLTGNLVKFYGVVGQPFFHWFCPFDIYRDTPESVDVENVAPDFDLDYLKEICARAADILEVKIYGGDAMVSADGTIRLIGFNDWPSFAPCRKEAAPYIAKCVIKEYKSWKKGRV